MSQRVLFTLCVLLFLAFVVVLSRAQTRVAPQQLVAPRLAVLACSGKTATSDCAGLYYVDLVTAGGTELRIVGPEASNGVTLDPGLWSVVP